MNKQEYTRIIELHKLFLDPATTHRGKRADFSHLSLHPYGNFSEDCPNMRGVDFRFANLYGCSFDDVDLLGANFEGANLQNTDIIDTHPDGGHGPFGIDHIENIVWPGALVETKELCFGWIENPDDKVSKWRIKNFKQNSVGVILKATDIEYVWDSNRPGYLLDCILPTFDIIVDGVIIKNIPGWVMYSGMKVISSPAPKQNWIPFDSEAD